MTGPAGARRFQLRPLLNEDAPRAVQHRARRRKRRQLAEKDYFEPRVPADPRKNGILRLGDLVAPLSLHID
eukprot:8916801-Pyramimonas_sp.AAC.1